MTSTRRGDYTRRCLTLRDSSAFNLQLGMMGIGRPFFSYYTLMAKSWGSGGIYYLAVSQWSTLRCRAGTQTLFTQKQNKTNTFIIWFELLIIPTTCVHNLQCSGYIQNHTTVWNISDVSRLVWVQPLTRFYSFLTHSYLFPLENP